MFRKCKKRIEFWVETLMLFDDFRVGNSQMAPKVSLNDRFYKVFLLTFPVASKHCFTNAFLMFCNIAKRIQLLLENLMILIILGPFFKKGSKSLLKRQVL